MNIKTECARQLLKRNKRLVPSFFFIPFLCLVMLLQACINPGPNIKFEKVYNKPPLKDERVLIYVIREDAFANSNYKLEIIQNDVVKSIIPRGTFTYFYGVNGDHIAGLIGTNLSVEEKISTKNGEAVYLYIEAEAYSNHFFKMEVLPEAKATEYIEDFNYVKSMDEIYPSEMNYKTLYENMYDHNRSSSDFVRYPNQPMSLNALDKINTLSIIVNHDGEMNPEPIKDVVQHDILNESMGSSYQEEPANYAFEIFSDSKARFLESVVPMGMLGMVSRENRLNLINKINNEFTRKISKTNINMAELLRERILRLLKISNYLIVSKINKGKPADAVLEVTLRDVGYVMFHDEIGIRVDPNEASSDPSGENKKAIFKPSILAEVKLTDNSKNILYTENIVYGVAQVPNLTRGRTKRFDGNRPIDSVKNKITILPLSRSHDEPKNSSPLVNDVDYTIREWKQGLHRIANEIAMRFMKND